MSKPVNISLYLFEMQESQRAWAKANFGEQTPIQMMVGLIGELGEFHEHHEDNYQNPCVDKIIDDIGDVGVYLLNYCSLKGWSIGKLFEGMKPANQRAVTVPWDIMPFIRWLPHHQLKGDQNIRGGTAFHDARMQDVLSNMLWQLNEVSKRFDTTFFDCLCKTWSKVSKRDWVLHPDNADEVVEKEASTNV